jgi:membrane-bound hydrogenase subunit beta
MLPEETTIQQQLCERFECLKDRVRVQRARRILAQVPAADVLDVFEYAVEMLRFSILATITGLDEGPTLGLIYHLAQENGIVLNLATSVPKDQPVLRTVTPYFPAAEAYEREVTDLLGFQIEGLPPGRRYPLPDDWPAGQYPLRKDWKGLPNAELCVGDPKAEMLDPVETQNVASPSGQREVTQDV